MISLIKQWLFGVEITDSIIVFCDKYIIFVASPKKLQFFKQVKKLTIFNNQYFT
jgi:hypothetical protein